MSFTYNINCIDSNVVSFNTQLEVITFLINNGLQNVSSIWKVSPRGNLCMYEHSFKSSMTSENYIRNYETLHNIYSHYQLNENDKKIMKMCD
jgi:hypothetical protein